MTQNVGVSPQAGPGHSAEPEPCSTVSAVPASVPNALRDIIRRREALIGERRDKTEAHKTFLLTTDAELARLHEAEALLVGGIDIERIARARQLISIVGKVGSVRHGVYDDQCRGDTRSNALADAKADIAAGGKKIRERYFGIKNYSGFGDQREDHEYGFGPKHGGIVFSIGLRHRRELTAAEIDDALYLLSALPKIETLQAEQVSA